MMNEILKSANAATASLCAANKVHFSNPWTADKFVPVEYDFNDAEEALKKLFLAGRLDLQNQGKHYCFDDFAGVLFPESDEYFDLCIAASQGLPVNFEKAFHEVLDKWIYYTIESMTDREIQEAMEQL